MRKLLIISALGVVAVSAQADVFNLVGVGTYTLGSGGYTTTENIVAQMTPFTLDTLNFAGTYSGNGAVGTMVFTGTGGSVTLSFTSGDFQYDSSGNASGLAGAWTFVSGTGSYSSYTTGSGTFGATYNAASNNYSSTTLSGNIQAVPEPATLAVLGLGALALRRRKRK